jgi:hypothetical protein
MNEPGGAFGRAQPGSADPGTVLKRCDLDPGARAVLARLSRFPCFSKTCLEKENDEGL